MKKTHKRLLIGTAIVLVLPATLFIFNSRRLVVTSFDVLSDELPASFDGYTIVQISDFHNQAIEYANTSIIEAVTSATPDIIVLTGDIIDERTNNLDRLEALFTGIGAYPTYYANGNHDIRAPLYEEFLTLLDSHGVVNLSGARETLTRGAQTVAIIGVEQTHVDDYWGFNTRTDPVITSHITPLIEAEDDFKILLSHHPEFHEEAAALGIDVMFSGHYHGGHVRLFDWSFAHLFDEKYGGGSFDVSGMRLIVNRGAGNGTIPFRINCDAEIVAVTLKRPV